MHRITLGSMFRDSAAYLPRYFQQVRELREVFDVRCVWAFGDCQDDTAKLLLMDRHPQDVIIQVNHGALDYGSIDVEHRWECIASVFSKLIEHVHDDAPFVWVESDLIWSPSAIWKLVDSVTTLPFDAVCPMVLVHGSDRFYDVWGYRRLGEHFQPYPPYIPDYVGDHIIKPRRAQVDSCGSCFACKPEVVPKIKEWGGHWPLVLDNLWLDQDITIYHPEPRG